jgi:hypothetical protein
MISLLRKSICCFCLLLIMALISCGYSNSSNIKEIDSRNNESKESEISKQLQGLELNIAVVVSDKPALLRLAFITKNNSNHDITIQEYPSWYNRLVITIPGRERKKDFRATGEIKQIVIKPSETKTWFENSLNLIEIMMLDNAEDFCRIKWKIYDVESNEILLLKEFNRASPSFSTIESYTKNNESKESEVLKKLQGLELNIALVVSDKDTSTKLAFIAKNNSKVDIEVSDFRVGENGIEIKGPNGKSGFNAILKGPTKPIVIKSSETKMWFMDPARLLIAHKEAGLYRIKWKIDKVESQEFLLLKEKAKNESEPNKT